MTAPSLLDEARHFMRRYRIRAVRDAVTSGAMAAMFAYIGVSSTDPWVAIGGVLATLGALVGLVWSVVSRPASHPTGAEIHLVYDRLLADAIHTARTAAMYTVLPLLPGTACIGVGLVLIPHRAHLPPLFGWALCVVVFTVLIVCWRMLWKARADHCAELIARREALHDALVSGQGLGG